MNIIEFQRAKAKLMQIERELVIAKPYIKIPPNKKDYGIGDDIEEKLGVLDNRFRTMQNIKALLFFALIIMSAFLFGLYKTNIIHKALIFASISTLPSMIVFLLMINKAVPKTSLHIAYDKFRKDVDNYKYWRGKDNSSYWHSLDGAAFEYALAELYNLYGYRATLTKRSGDKGVDIILEKDHDIIIVQCKAHKVRISPHVARKLYDSMNYFGVNKSILASVSGFTPGVYDYACDKNIELLDTNDILSMMNTLEKDLEKSKII